MNATSVIHRVKATALLIEMKHATPRLVLLPYTNCFWRQRLWSSLKICLLIFKVAGVTPAPGRQHFTKMSQQYFWTSMPFWNLSSNERRIYLASPWICTGVHAFQHKVWDSNYHRTLRSSHERCYNCLLALSSRYVNFRLYEAHHEKCLNLLIKGAWYETLIPNHLTKQLLNSQSPETLRENNRLLIVIRH